MSWTSDQKKVVIATFLGWMLDAFDFFLMVFVLKNIAAEFGTQVIQVSIAITLTLAMRPLGALIFGRLADKWGRRPIMMINIAAYSVFEFLTGFSTNLTMFLVLRALYGIAMGGEWGIGSALAMESVPVHARGFVSGLLQAGYPGGYLLASVVFGLFFPLIGWRGLFMIGIAPAFLLLYLRRNLPESPTWKEGRSLPKKGLLVCLQRDWKLLVYSVILMTAFTFLSHGTQDLYPTFLAVQHNFSVHMISIIAVIYNVGAILGGLFFGIFSERLGRRVTIFIALALIIPLLWLWGMSTTPLMLALGAFLMQFAVQGAWGVIPAYLNEISPGEVRATFPGLVLQLGNLFSSGNAIIQTSIASQLDGNYGLAMMLTVGITSVVIAICIFFGRERRGVSLAIA
jgi:SHS family lactate transporter-like MFS transporter